MRATHTLSKKQLASIGYEKESEIPEVYWNKQLCKCFSKYKSSKSEEKYLQNDTFKQFIEMDLNGANSQGTGRYRFQDIEKIEFVIIQMKKIKLDNKESNLNGSIIDRSSKKQQLNQKRRLKNKSQINSTSNQIKNNEKVREISKDPSFQVCIKGMEDLLSSFFQIKVQHNPQIKISIDADTNKIVDETQMIEFQVKQIGESDKGNQFIKKRAMYDVWQLFDIGLEYKKKFNFDQNSKKKKNSHSQDSQQQNYRNSILLFLIEADLMQDDSGIDGRAIGDGVAFISFNKSDFESIDIDQDFALKEYPCYTLAILIHQCLHTLGLDHCSAWECLMNSVTNNEFMLCPCCVRKLQSEINYKTDLKGWYLQMAKTLNRLKKLMISQFGQNKSIKMFSDLLFSKTESLKNQQKSSNKNKGTNKILIKRKTQKKSLTEKYLHLSMLEKCQMILQSWVG